MRYLFILLWVCCCSPLLAQPQHISLVGATNNSFPYNSTSSNKTQAIYSPGDFTPTLAGAPRLLNKIYIYASTASPNVTFSNFTISIGHTTLGVFGANTWATGLTQVYYAASKNFTGTTAGAWLSIDLTTPFLWDGTSNIIVELSHSGYTGSGISVLNYRLNGNKRLHGNVANATATGIADGQSHIGFDLGAVACTGTPNAGFLTSNNATVTCGDSTTVYMNNQATETGITLRWEKSTDNGTTWSLVDTNVDSVHFAELVQNTLVRVVTTCNPSNSSATSNVLSLQVVPTRINLGNDTTICDNTTIDLSVASYNPASVTWDNASNNMVRSVSQSGTYSVEVTMANTCVAKDTIVVRDARKAINPFPASYNLCEEDTLTLNAQNNGMTYLWSNNATTPSIQVLADGNYSVTITSQDACVATFNTQVIERPFPIIAIPVSATICDGDSILIDGTALHGFTYRWNDNTTQPLKYLKDQMEYTLTVTSEYGCVSTASTDIIHRPSAGINGFSFIPGFYQDSKKVAFSPINPTNVSSYLWRFGDGSSSTLSNPTHEYAEYGIYEVTVTVTNDCGDRKYSQVINIELDGGTTLDGITNDAINIYPNPASDLLYIKSSTNITKVELLSVDGRLLKVVDVVNNTVPLADLGNGMYVLKLETERGTGYHKFQIQR